MVLGTVAMVLQTIAMVLQAVAMIQIPLLWSWVTLLWTHEYRCYGPGFLILVNFSDIFGDSAFTPTSKPLKHKIDGFNFQCYMVQN